MNYRFDFVGGCRDGESVSMASDDPRKALFADCYRRITGDGTIGRSAKVLSPRDEMRRKPLRDFFDQIANGVPPEEIGGTLHIYTVVEREEDGDQIVVKMQYNPET